MAGPVETLAAQPPLVQGLVGGLVIAGLNLLGASLVLVGVVAVTVAAAVLPYAMGFAAGAMVYVISDEIVPETHVRGNERVATIGTIVGVVVMLYLDVSLS
jgi:ZIP family zinc transporter